MNSDQRKIKSLLSYLTEDKDNNIKPSTKSQIEIFTNRAIKNGVDQKVIKQLVDLYQVADFFHYEIIIGFHHCEDPIIFDWWDEKELWLGQRDFNTLRWSNGKFCLGDESQVSFSDEYKFDTLIELIECCIKDIDQANSFDKQT